LTNKKKVKVLRGKAAERYAALHGKEDQLRKEPIPNPVSKKLRRLRKRGLATW
jgi:hypothetical protein